VISVALFSRTTFLDFVSTVLRNNFRGSFLHRSKFANLLYQLIWKVLADKDSTRSVRFRNLTFSVPTNEITILPSLIDGTYEFNELNFFLNHLELNAVVLDVGANIGIYSLPIATHLTQGFVYAFEPSSESARLLTENARSNGIVNIEVVEMAASSITGYHYFLDSEVGGRRRILESHIGLEVQAVRIDDWIAERGISIDAIKIDVEGWESSVIQGMTNLLKSKPTLLLECNMAAQGNNFHDFDKQLEFLFGHYDRVISFEGLKITPLKTSDLQQVRESKALVNLLFLQNH
jgi:FkbM family methyltransferase